MGMHIAFGMAFAAMFLGSQSTEPGALAACGAKSLSEATHCLRTRLSEADRMALIGAQGGSMIRGDIDKLVRYEFRLYDFSSEVGTWLRKRGIISPLIQSSVIIDEYLAQQRGASLDLRKIAKVSADAPLGTAPTLADVEPRAPQVKPQDALSREECAAILKLPLDELGQCFRDGDKIIAVQKTIVSPQ